MPRSVRDGRLREPARKAAPIPGPSITGRRWREGASEAPRNHHHTKESCDAVRDPQGITPGRSSGHDDDGQQRIPFPGCRPGRWFRIGHPQRDRVAGAQRRNKQPCGTRALTPFEPEAWHVHSGRLEMESHFMDHEGDGVHRARANSRGWIFRGVRGRPEGSGQRVSGRS